MSFGQIGPLPRVRQAWHHHHAHRVFFAWRALELVFHGFKRCGEPLQCYFELLFATKIRVQVISQIFQRADRLYRNRVRLPPLLMYLDVHCGELLPLILGYIKGESEGTKLSFGLIKAKH